MMYLSIVGEILMKQSTSLSSVFALTSCVCWGCLLVDIKNITLAYITMDDIAIGA
jgi:hypothetical protein